MTRHLKSAVQRWFREQNRFTPCPTSIPSRRRELSFTDGCDQECSVYSEGPKGNETLWLGRRFEPMQLTREIAADLLPILHHYVEYGEVPQTIEKFDPVHDVLDVL